MVRNCDYGRPCRCNECLHCNKCKMIKSVNFCKYGPRGGLLCVEMTCACKFNNNIICADHLTNFCGQRAMMSWENFGECTYCDDLEKLGVCTFCCAPMLEQKTDVMGYGGGITGIMNVFGGITKPYGYTVTYECKNEKNHNVIIQNNTCTKCNKFIQCKTHRIEHDKLIYCLKCYDVLIEQIKCAHCNEYVWKKQENDNMHSRCKTQIKK